MTRRLTILSFSEEIEAWENLRQTSSKYRGIPQARERKRESRPRLTNYGSSFSFLFFHCMQEEKPVRPAWKERKATTSSSSSSVLIGSLLLSVCNISFSTVSLPVRLSCQRTSHLFCNQVLLSETIRRFRIEREQPLSPIHPGFLLVTLRLLYYTRRFCFFSFPSKDLNLLLLLAEDGGPYISSLLCRPFDKVDYWAG